MSYDVLPMACFDCFHGCFCVDHGGTEILVPQHFADVLDRHSVMQGNGRSRVPQDVRSDVLSDGCSFGYVPYDLLDPALVKLRVWSFLRNEQVVTVISARIQICPEGNLRLCVDKAQTVFLSFTEEVNARFSPVHIRLPQGCEFTDTAAGTIQCLNDR